MRPFIDDVTFFLPTLIGSVAVAVTVAIAVAIAVFLALHLDAVEDDGEVFELVVLIEFFQFGQIATIQDTRTDNIYRKVGYTTNDTSIGNNHGGYTVEDDIIVQFLQLFDQAGKRSLISSSEGLGGIIPAEITSNCL